MRNTIFAVIMGAVLVGEGLLLLHYGTGKTYYGKDSVTNEDVYYKQEDIKTLKWLGRLFICVGIVELINDTR